MLVRSAVKPDSIWLRNKEGLTLTLRVRWNIKPLSVQDMDGKTHAEFEYEEEEITHEVPAAIKIEKFKNYLGDKIPDLLAEAKAKITSPPIKVEPETATLANRPLEDLREDIITLQKVVAK